MGANGGVSIHGIAKAHKLAVLNGRHGQVVGFDGHRLLVQLDRALTQAEVTAQLGDEMLVKDVALDERGRVVEVPEACTVRDEYLAP